MTRFLIFDTVTDARRAVVAISAALGLPRTLTETEVRRDPGVRARALPRVQAYTSVRAVTAGRLAGKFVVAVNPADLAALDGTTLAVPATYDGTVVPGGAGRFALVLAAAEVPSRAHDGEVVPT